MIQFLIGRKIDQTQGFLEDGTRVPLSIISVGGNVVSQIKTSKIEGYNAIQLGFGSRTRPTKPMTGHIKKAGLQKMPRFFREIRVDESPVSPPASPNRGESLGGPDYNLGSAILVSEVFEPGDVVDVTGISKGKGFAGVVKRHGFHGGPRTHGQSDRERAPGSIGQTTTPGRVYRGKRMAGRMGNEQVTIKNLEILGVKEDTILVRGLVPGAKGSIVTIKKVGKNKKFKPLWSEDRGQNTEDGEQKTEATEEQTSLVEETQVEKSAEIESKMEEGSSVGSRETIKEEENAR
ncbi:MAG: 50S ribosomal protein L3 [Candidatus Levybacteria bacterium RIFCSPHIGHO2_01_FULL_40_15b]|nr:MAG: 50S ribosomal protein L3 [Candidatus Levybacteria bacterium RIFCSPHIGHO2_01_FULL_40_15b]